MNHVVKFWLALLLALVGLYGGYSLWRISSRSAADAQASSAGQADRAPLTGFKVGAFKLIERSGKPFDSRELKGKVWVASFFYSNCSGACLALNNGIAALQDDLAGDPVTFVSITVDPERDTPERLREYAAHYGADPERWLFLTGDADEIERVVVDGFKVAFSQVSHSDRMILVDREGRVQGYFFGTDPSQVTVLKRRIAKLVEGGT